MPVDRERCPGMRGLINGQPGVWCEKEWQMHVGIQRQFLKPPNESVWDLAELRFGRSQYEDLFSGKWRKSHPHLYEETELGHLRVKRGWQKLLEPPDPYACCLLCHDPTWQWSVEDGGVFRKPYELWNPMRLMNSFLSKGSKIVDEVVRIMGEAGLPDTRKLSKTINVHIRTVYLPGEEERWKEQRADQETWSKFYKPVTWEEHKLKVYRFIEDTAHLIGGACLHHFQVHGDLWRDLLFDCAVLEEQLFDAKLQLERRRLGEMNFDFPEENGELKPYVPPPPKTSGGMTFDFPEE